ncbi:MAG: putative metalloprotease with PDZ domain [Cryomorphaceae bacterium]|jgi:predicted metalloprotease with PDZ domain
MIEINSKIALLLLSISLSMFTLNALAGKEGKKIKGKDSQAEIEWELSYLAKRMLDLKGTDSYTLERKAVTKPFIGICSDVNKSGVAITCITPDSQASKSGLKTGDLLIFLNDVSMANQDEHGKDDGKDDGKPSYWSIVKSMKVGDKLKMGLLRAGEPVTIDVTVGTLHHPAYRFEIGK